MPESAPISPASANAIRPDCAVGDADQPRAEPVHRGGAQRLAEQRQFEERRQRGHQNDGQARRSTSLGPGW